jgi:hypothetical protein
VSFQLPPCPGFVLHKELHGRVFKYTHMFGSLCPLPGGQAQGHSIRMPYAYPVHVCTRIYVHTSWLGRCSTVWTQL